MVDPRCFQSGVEGAVFGFDAAGFSMVNLPLTNRYSEADFRGLCKKKRLFQYPAFYRWRNLGNYVQASGAGRYVGRNPGGERGNGYHQRPKPNRA